MIYVILNVLRTINEHYIRLLKTQKNDTTLLFCIESFRRIMKFSCAHEIEKRFVDIINEKILKLIDIHFHWKYQKSRCRYIEFATAFVKFFDEKTFFSNFSLQIQNSRKIKTKKPSIEAFNKIRKEKRQKGEEKRNRRIK